MRQNVAPRLMKYTKKMWDLSDLLFIAKNEPDSAAQENE